MIKEQLLALAEPEYQKFSSRLLPRTENIIGVRLPHLRKIAKQIANQEGSNYLLQADDTSFEEVMIQGMVIGYLQKSDIVEVLALVATFVPKINNWSVCDSFCSGLKITKHHRERVWQFLKPYLHSSHEFEVRFAIVMMLNYYLDQDYLEEVLKELDQINHQGYYVQMAIAWAISICFIQNQDLTLGFLNQNNLDDFTYNKALQKIIESLKVDSQTKEIIRDMKRTS